MSIFTVAEIAYLRSQRLGRLAAVDRDGQPHVVPVSFHYNEGLETIDIGGHDFASRKKFRDVRSNPKVAFVVDDLASVQPWAPRMIEIRGVAEILKTGGEKIMRGFAPQMFRVRPKRIISFGIDGGFAVNARSIE